MRSIVEGASPLRGRLANSHEGTRVGVVAGIAMIFALLLAFMSVSPSWPRRPSLR